MNLFKTSRNLFQVDFKCNSRVNDVSNVSEFQVEEIHWRWERYALVTYFSSKLVTWSPGSEELEVRTRRGWGADFCSLNTHYPHSPSLSPELSFCKLWLLCTRVDSDLEFGPELIDSSFSLTHSLTPSLCAWRPNLKCALIVLIYNKRQQRLQWTFDEQRDKSELSLDFEFTWGTFRPGCSEYKARG